MKPFAHTFSIVAFDPETGQLGVGLQSHWFASGAVVPWAEPGIGAVATQAQVDSSYGNLGLALMRAGKSSRQALTALLSADTSSTIRQVAMVDYEGIVAVHTGSNCIASAGHCISGNFCTQGNFLTNDRVWEKMADSYTHAKGDFSERLLQALETGQDAGGDVRGRQSAALLVVPAPGDPLNRDTITNLRVDDSTQPLIDLRRLLTVQRGYEWHAQAIYAVETGDLNVARQHYSSLRGLAVGTREPQFWYATTLAEHGYLEESLPIFSEVFQVEPIWLELIDRLVDAGVFPQNKAIINKVKSLAVEGKK